MYLINLHCYYYYDYYYYIQIYAILNLGHALFWPEYKYHERISHVESLISDSVPFP